MRRESEPEEGDSVGILRRSEVTGQVLDNEQREQEKISRGTVVQCLYYCYGELDM